jgi:CHAT domain-containing protein
MTLIKNGLMACCLALSTLFVQAATLEEQAQLLAAKRHINAIFLYYQRGEFKNALPWAEKVLKIRTEILGEKHVDTFEALNLLALSYQKLGRLEEALSVAEKSFSLFQEVEADLGYNKAANLLILTGIYLGLGQLDKALVLAEKSVSLAGEDALLTIITHSQLAVIYYQLGRFNEALPLLEKSVSLVTTLSDEDIPTSSQIQAILDNPFLQSCFGKDFVNLNLVQTQKLKLTAQMLNNLASIYYQLGQIDKALPLFEKAYCYRLEAFGEKHPETLESMTGLAAIYLDLGRLAEALSLFEKGYRFARQGLGEKHSLTIVTLNNLAKMYQELGRLDEALPLFENSYRLSKAALGEKHFQTLTILINLAVINRELGDNKKALFLFEKGYRLAREAFGDKHFLTIASVNNLADIHRTSNQLDKALSWFDKAYRLAGEVFGEKNLKTIASLNNLASVYRELGRHDEALPLIEKSYQLYREVLGDNNPLTLTSLSNLAVLYVEQGSTQKALEHLEQLVAGVESLRRSDLSAENRQAWFKNWAIRYFALSYLYIKESRFQEAFRLAEMSKARTLLESLAAELAAQQSGLTAIEQQQLQANEARLAFLNNRIAKAWENNRHEEKLALESEKNQRVRQFNQFHRELMEKYPKYAQLNEVQIIGAQQGAKSLPADAVLISYLVAKDKVNENKVLVFTLQPDGTLTAHDLGKIPNLKTNVEDYQRQLSLLGRGRPIERSHELQKDRETLSRELGKQLLGPLSAIIKDKSHWIISPYGPLALIPFETLRLDGEAQPVIAQHHITYVQSLSVLKLLQEREKEYKVLKKRGTLLAMGAPRYAKNSQGLTKRSENELGGLAENPNRVEIARRLVRSGDYGRAVRQFGQMRWINLPGALAELEQLEALFKETQPAIYIQEKATEAQLQSLNQQRELANYRYLVFSAHGYLSPQVSALSSIVLGQASNPPGIDGYVTAGEWPGYDLKSDLMVLSACETGRGEVVGGEGVMGLPYAFYVAGNKNTILTLWSISDKVTTEFVTSFFAKLKAGMGQVDALTATKREFLKKGGRYSNPAYWAAFVLYGV